MPPRVLHSEHRVIKGRNGVPVWMAWAILACLLLGPRLATAQDTTKVRPEQVQALLDKFHLGKVTRMAGELGVEHLTDKEMALRRKFLGERLSVGFQKPFPIDRKEERWDVEYKLKGDLLLRGQLHRQDASQQGSVDLLFRHEY